MKKSNKSTEEYIKDWNSRECLKLYENMDNVPFHCTYAYKSTLTTGSDVACIQDLRDPITKEVIAQHAWLRISPQMAKTLHLIKKNTPVIVHAKVISYYDKHGVRKLGLKPRRINLVHTTVRRLYNVTAKNELKPEAKTELKTESTSDIKHINRIGIKKV